MTKDTLLKKGGRSRGWMVPMGIILISLFLAVMGLRQLVGSLGYRQVALDQSNSALGIGEDTPAPKGVVTVALFGVDSGEEGFQGRSDSIMLLSVDQNRHSVKVISVLRDSLVRVEGYGNQKINAAYSLGGPQLAVKTLNQTFGLNIRNYVTVDFQSMAELVDAVGGIEVELTPAEVESANGTIASLCFEKGVANCPIGGAGVQRLNGVQAVGYSRIRKVPTPTGTNDDFGRTERQRNVMGQLFQKALVMNRAKYPALVRKLLPFTETSLDYRDILNLAGILGEKDVTLLQDRMPANQIIIDADFHARNLGSCVYYDTAYAAGMMQGLIYENIPFETYMTEHTVTYHRWYP